MMRGDIGMMDSPAQGNRRPAGVTWAADNGCFGNGYPGDATWLAWLDSATREERARCLFATAPDVVADAESTWARSAPFLPVIRAWGYPAALVAQNGIEHTTVEWDSFDALFIGGDTTWKLGPAARAVAREAKRRGKWLHMGRVNSERRLRYSSHIGCDSVDGTYLAFGPDENLPKLLGWSRRVGGQLGLFGLAVER